MTRIPELLLPALAALLLAAPARSQSADPRAVDVALGALDAIERSWAIEAYDAADRVRTAINLRGGSANVTGNLVVDRRARRWRLDTGGGVGPLTFAVAGGAATLYVPSLGQFATRPAGALSPTGIGFSPKAELAAARARLTRGYEFLVHVGVETVDGASTDRIRDTPAPGVTVDYWIDRETSLPRRVLVAEGERETRVELRYGAGPRPTEVVVATAGRGASGATLSPAYDTAGRVKLLHAAIRPPSGPRFTADLRLDWNPRLASGFFAFAPPSGAERVPFQQLVTGVLFSAAGQLGGLLPLVTGGR